MQIYPNPLKVGDTTYSGTQNSDARNISRNAGKSYNILQQSAHDSQESTSPSLIVERAHHIYNGRHVSSIDTLSSDDGMEEKPTKTRSNLGICAMRELRHHKKWPLYSPAQLALGRCYISSANVIDWHNLKRNFAERAAQSKYNAKENKKRIEHEYKRSETKS